MSKNLSATKRDQIALRNKLYNKSYKSSIKTSVKKVLSYVNNMYLNDHQKLYLLLGDTYSKIDKAVKRGIMPKNQAARRKSRLAKKIKSIITS